ncbi:MAG TPA: hypothetical protein VJR70_03810 [Stellaceae bacterium]|nr:hypothetical protein [Stellaceae bacterium]
MVLVEHLKKAGRGIGIATALAATVAMTAAPGAAYARDWHGGGWHGGGWRGGGWGGGGWGGGWHHHRGFGGGIALGLLGGALAGAAIASASPYYYYPYSYSYSYPYYGYYNPYYGYGYYGY